MVIQAPPVPISVSGNQPVSTSSQDCLIEVDYSGCRQINSTAPRGILKHLSASSSTDSQFPRFDLDSPLSLASATETWIDRKQVRFTSALSQSGAEWQDGKELGEHSVLDNDSLSERENSRLNSRDLENTYSSPITHRALPSLSLADSQEAELTCKDEAGQHEHDAGRDQEFGGKAFMKN